MNKYSTFTRFIWSLEQAFYSLHVKLQHARVRSQLSDIEGSGLGIEG